MTVRYVLTSDAEADVRDIARYTLREWGEAQARKYAAALNRGIERVVAGERGFKDLGDLHQGLRMIRCEHHYIFCLPRDGSPALIVAIFHERMDLMVRLAGRLGDM